MSRELYTSNDMGAQGSCLLIGVGMLMSNYKTRIQRQRKQVRNMAGTVYEFIGDATYLLERLYSPLLHHLV